MSQLEQLPGGHRVLAKIDSRVRLGLLATLLAAFGLRVHRLATPELRGDEAFGYFFSLRAFDDIVRATVSLREPHPVASYFIEKAWLSWAGHSEFALRFVSVWFGVLAVALIYRLARRLQLSSNTALIAAVLLAVSPYAVWHSQDARMYAISLALTLFSTWLALEALQRQRWTTWLAYLAISWVALHTHYFALFILIAQNLFVISRSLILRNRRRQLPLWLGVQAALIILYLPWLVQVLPILTEYAGNGDSPSFLAMIERSLSVFAAGQTGPAGWSPWLALLSLLLMAFGAVRLALVPSDDGNKPGGLGGRWTLWLLALYLIVPIGATWVGSLSRPIFDERYLIAAVPPVYLLISAGLGERPLHATRPSAARLAWRSLQVVLLGIVFIGSLLSLRNHFYDPAYSKTRGWRELAKTLERLSVGLPEDDVRLAQNFPDPTLWFYYQGPIRHTVLPPQAHDARGAGREVAQLRDSGVQRILFVEQPAAWWDDAGVARQALESHYQLATGLQVEGWPVQAYSHIDPETLRPASIAFANGLTLAGIAVEPVDPVHATVPGGMVVVHLDWQGSTASLEGTEKVFLHLVDENDTPIAQTDRPLDPAVLQQDITTYGILLPEDIAMGDYRLLAGLYDPAQAGAPRIPTSGGQDTVQLTTVALRPPSSPVGIGP
jgi:hypothetical protein